jgi:hypothetical protein
MRSAPFEPLARSFGALKRAVPNLSQVAFSGDYHAPITLHRTAHFSVSNDISHPCITKQSDAPTSCRLRAERTTDWFYDGDTSVCSYWF